MLLHIKIDYLHVIKNLASPRLIKKKKLLPKSLNIRGGFDILYVPIVHYCVTDGVHQHFAPPLNLRALFLRFEVLNVARVLWKKWKWLSLVEEFVLKVLGTALNKYLIVYSLL
jgi:hypothetical protein